MVIIAADSGFLFCVLINFCAICVSDLVKHRPLVPRGDLWLKEMPSMSYPDRLYESWR